MKKAYRTVAVLLILCLFINSPQGIALSGSATPDTIVKLPHNEKLHDLSTPNAFNPPCVVTFRDGKYTVDPSLSRSGMLESSPRAFFIHMIAAALGRGLNIDQTKNLLQETFGDGHEIHPFSWEQLEYIDGKFELYYLTSDGRPKKLIFSKQDPGGKNRVLTYAGGKGINRGQIWLKEEDTENSSAPDADNIPALDFMHQKGPVSSDREGTGEQKAVRFAERLSGMLSSGKSAEQKKAVEYFSEILRADPRQGRVILTVIARDYEACSYLLPKLSRGSFIHLFLPGKTPLSDKDMTGDSEAMQLIATDRALADFFIKDKSTNKSTVTMQLVSREDIPFAEFMLSYPETFSEILETVYSNGIPAASLRKNLKRKFDALFKKMCSGDNSGSFEKFEWLMRVRHILLFDTKKKSFLKPDRSRIVIEIDARALCSVYSRPVPNGAFDHTGIDTERLLNILRKQDEDGRSYLNGNTVTDKFQGLTGTFRKDLAEITEDGRVLESINSVLQEFRGGLKNVPEEFWEKITEWGSGTIWLKAAWKKSSLSHHFMKHCQEHNREENLNRWASGYDIFDYELDPVVGTDDDFIKIAGKLKEKNINLCLDFVTNHLAKDSPLAREVDGLVIRYSSMEEVRSAAKAYFPDDVFESLTAQWEEAFTRLDTITGDPGDGNTWLQSARYDGFKLSQLAQIMYTDERARRYIIKNILKKIAKLTLNGGIRADLAYLALQDTVYWNWGAPLGLSPEEFHEVYPREFWTEFMEEVNENYPGMVVFAELYEFGEEGTTRPWIARTGIMQNEGVVTYEKHLYDLLKSGDVKSARAFLLQDSPILFWNKTMSFSENHDEYAMETAFGKRERGMAATAVLISKMGYMLVPLRQMLGMKMPEGAKTEDWSQSGDSAIYEYYYPGFGTGGFSPSTEMENLLEFMSLKVFREGDMYSAATDGIYRAVNPDADKEKFFTDADNKDKWYGLNIGDSNIFPFLRRLPDDEAVCLVNYGDSAEAVIIDLDTVYSYYPSGPGKITGDLYEHLESEGVRFTVKERKLYVQLPPWGYAFFRFTQDPAREKEWKNTRITDLYDAIEASFNYFMEFLSGLVKGLKSGTLSRGEPALPAAIENNKPKSIVLFADSVVDDFAFLDIRETLAKDEFRSMFRDSSGLASGSIVLYGSEEKCAFLRDIIESSGDLAVLTINSEPGPHDEKEELLRIVRTANRAIQRDTGINHEFVGVIKGRTGIAIELEEFCSQEEFNMPIVLFNKRSGNGIFSFEMAVMKLFERKYSKDPASWLCFLDPVVVLTNDLQRRMLEKIETETKA